MRYLSLRVRSQTSQRERRVSDVGWFGGRQPHPPRQPLMAAKSLGSDDGKAAAYTTSLHVHPTTLQLLLSSLGWGPNCGKERLNLPRQLLEVGEGGRSVRRLGRPKLRCSLLCHLNLPRLYLQFLLRHYRFQRLSITVLRPPRPVTRAVLPTLSRRCPILTLSSRSPRRGGTGSSPLPG